MKTKSGSLEPVYVAQTFEKKHTASAPSAHQWWADQMEIAKKKRGNIMRCSSINVAVFRNTDIREDVDGKGLLFEAWRHAPQEYGDPRWSLKNA